MALLAASLVLTEFSNSANSRTYLVPGHTNALPSKCTHRRRIPTGNQTVVEDTFVLTQKIADVDGVALPQPITFELKMRRPLVATQSELANVRLNLDRIMSSDEFVLTMTQSTYVA